jgi:hypothetical protein
MERTLIVGWFNLKSQCVKQSPERIEYEFLEFFWARVFADAEGLKIL